MSFLSVGALSASSSRRSDRALRRRWWRPRRLVILAAVLPLFALAACHQEFGSDPHGGPAAGSGARATNIRTAVQPGYDRGVFDFSGPVPAYVVQYVAANQLKGSNDQVVPVTGTNFLQVRFDGTNANADAPFVRTPGFAEVKQVKRVDNFEGVLIYGVGVAQRH